MKKKFGYTLAEVLIALTIIGILAAVSLPLVNKYSPDTAKIKYLKTYDTIREVVPIIVASNTFYPREDNLDFQGNPLLNVASVSVGAISYGDGAKKFCQILGAFLSDNVNCKEEYLDNTSYTEDQFDRSFRSRNGVDFFVTTVHQYSSPGAENAYQSDIYFDVDGMEKGKNCLYNEDTCPKPDRFKLMVSANGTTRVGDKIGKYYLDNRINWKSRNLDLSGYENFDPTLFDLDDYDCGALLPNGKYKNCFWFTSSGVQFSKKIKNNPVKVYVDYTDGVDMYPNLCFQVAIDKDSDNILYDEEIPGFEETVGSEPSEWLSQYKKVVPVEDKNAYYVYKKD